VRFLVAVSFAPAGGAHTSRAPPLTTRSPDRARRTRHTRHDERQRPRAAAAPVAIVRAPSDHDQRSRWPWRRHARPPTVR